MKKLTALLLAALMLLSSFAALAQEYSLDRKLQLQLLNGSGLKATAALSVTPDLRMTALDAATNTALAALLPNATLELNYIRSTSVNKGQEDLQVILKKGGLQAAELRYGSDGVLEALSSSILGGQSLVSARGDGRLPSLFGGEPAGRWPGLQRAMLAMQFSDNAWRAKGEAALKPYLDKLSLWLQPYTKIESAQDAAGKPLTTNTITVPVAAVKAQMKQMLTDAYQDQELMGLLRAQLSTAEILAYLQPSMLPGIQAAIDQLPLTGELTVLRRYDQAGELVYDELKLPFAGAQGLESIHYLYELGADKQGSTSLVIAHTPQDAKAQGAVTELTFKGGRMADALEGDDTYSYTGSLLKQPEAAQGFTVAEGTARPGTRFDFNLYVSATQEKYDEVAKVGTQDYEITLLLKPQGIEGLADQSIKLSAQLNSAVGDGKATRFTGKLVWQDLSTQGSITADLTGSSVAPWVIPSVNTVGALRLDAMNDQQLAAQKAQVQQALAGALATLARSLLSPAAP